MKRKLKIAGLSLVLVSLGSAVINGAMSGGVGFGLFVILCFFAAVFSLIGTFVVCILSYRMLKKHFALPKAETLPSKPQKKVEEHNKGDVKTDE